MIQDFVFTNENDPFSSEIIVDREAALDWAYEKLRRAGESRDPTEQEIEWAAASILDDLS